MHEIVIVVFILMPQVSPKSEEYRNLFRLPQDEVSELKILFFFFFPSFPMVVFLAVMSFLCTSCLNYSNSVVAAAFSISLEYEVDCYLMYY